MFPPNKGAVQYIAQVIKAIMLSVAEAELGALINAKQAASMHHMIIELRHPQLPTPIQPDNLME